MINMIYVSLTKIKVPLIPGLIHWNLAWITSKLFLSLIQLLLRNTPWPGVFRAWPVDISGIRMFFHEFPRVVPNPFSCVLDIGGLPQPQRWKGSPWFKGWDGDGWDGDGWKGCRFCVEKVCFQDLPHRVNIIKRWMHRFLYGLQWPHSERPSGNAEFCQAHGVWRP